MSPSTCGLCSGGALRNRASSSTRPTSACTIAAYARRCDHELSPPHPLIEQYTSDGLAPRSAAASRPYCSSAPGRKFSSTTSLANASSRAKAAPRSVFRSTDTERFPAFTQVKYTLTGSSPTLGWRKRMTSPPGGSNFTTSAPRSASMRPQIGPETTCDRSRTEIPSSGRPSSGRGVMRGSVVVEQVDHGLGHVADHHLADRVHVRSPVHLGVVAGADGDELDQALLRADAALARRERVALRRCLAHRGDGAGDDLVEHLGHDADRLVARELDEALVEAGVGA